MSTRKPKADGDRGGVGGGEEHEPAAQSIDETSSAVSTSATAQISKTALSRRAFLRGGAASALGATLLPEESAAAVPGAPATVDEAAATPIGPNQIVEVELSVNGQLLRVAVEPRVTLLDALRDRLAITGPKKVCDRATCGACTVWENGELIYACTRLAVAAHGAEITTVEGLGSPERLHPVQAAFVEYDAQQCGFCTPGMVVATTHLLRSHPTPTEAQVEAALGGNLCRCGTYVGIQKVALSQGVAASLRGGE